MMATAPKAENYSKKFTCFIFYRQFHLFPIEVQRNLVSTQQITWEQLKMTTSLYSFRWS